MHLDDLFAATAPGPDPWSSPVEEPQMDVIQNLIAGPLTGDDDLATAVALASLVHSELEEFGTAAQNQRLDGDQIAPAQRALRATLARHGINLNLPWRDFSGFRSYWINRGASGAGGWQARRDILGKFFGPVFAELDRLEDAAFASAVAEGVSPESGTGWPAVDAALDDVKVRFRSAVTSADYQEVQPLSRRRARSRMAPPMIVSLAVGDLVRGVIGVEEGLVQESAHVRVGCCVVGERAFASDRDEAGESQLGEMLAHARGARADQLGQTVDRCLPLQQRPHDPDPIGVPQEAKGVGSEVDLDIGWHVKVR